MKQLINPPKSNWNQLFKRPSQKIAALENAVNEIFREVSMKGDQAVKKYTELFDGVTLGNLTVTSDEVKSAKKAVSEDLKDAIQLAKSNIDQFHRAQITGKIDLETMPGVRCWQEKRPIQKVGLYIPGGTAPLFSTVLMLAVPAQIAGCKEIVLCTPPNKTGEIANEILYAADLCGITKIFKVGGIQAIAGLCFGTEQIPKVYKVFGPGNQYVTAAKQAATKFGIAIDMPAGPSELMIVADDTANSAFIASDLLSQAEHGIDSQVILVSNSRQILEFVEEQILKQITDLPRRIIAEKVLEYSKFIYLDKQDTILEFINTYAPEHLIICMTDWEYYTENIVNAGSVFIGNYTPESAGDYASGTNHTLPTNGFSTAYSGVNLDSFLKAITFQKITEEGLQNIGPSIELMAEAEGLLAHKRAISLRLNILNNISAKNKLNEQL